MIKQRFGDPESLFVRTSELEKQLVVEGREGENSGDTITLSALDRISGELLATYQPSLFGK